MRRGNSPFNPRMSRCRFPSTSTIRKRLRRTMDGLPSNDSCRGISVECGHCGTEPPINFQLLFFFGKEPALVRKNSVKPRSELQMNERKKKQQLSARHSDGSSFDCASDRELSDRPSTVRKRLRNTHKAFVTRRPPLGIFWLFFFFVQVDRLFAHSESPVSIPPNKKRSNPRFSFIYLFISCWWSS